jgi:hypothetical protein
MGSRPGAPCFASPPPTPTTPKRQSDDDDNEVREEKDLDEGEVGDCMQFLLKYEHE